MSSVVFAFVVTLGFLLGMLAVATRRRPTWQSPRRSAVAWWLVSSPLAFIAGLWVLDLVDPFQRPPGDGVAAAGFCVAIVLFICLVLSRYGPGYLVRVAVPLAAIVAPMIAFSAFGWHSSEKIDAWGLEALMYLGWTYVLSIIGVVVFAVAFWLRLTDETEAVRARDEWAAKSAAPGE